MKTMLQMKWITIASIAFFKCDGENVQNYDSKSSVKTRISVTLVFKELTIQMNS